MCPDCARERAAREAAERERDDARSMLSAEREGHRRTEVEKASLRVLLMQMQTDRDHYSSRLAAALAAPPEGGNE